MSGNEKREVWVYVVGSAWLKGLHKFIWTDRIRNDHTRINSYVASNRRENQGRSFDLVLENTQKLL